MRKINLAKASVLTSPNPLTVVCTKKTDGSTNFATVSWWTYLSYNPPMVAFAMAKTSYTGEMLRENKEVLITIPGEEIKEEVMGCGRCSGRDTDKKEKFDIQLQNVEESSIEIPLHSRVAIICCLKEYIETGDHYLYICNVCSVYANTSEEALFALDGYTRLGTVKV